jgi:protein-S-isoprenylcysteine O-methyltransferase
MSQFHLLEFAVTVCRQPEAASSDSFLVNHSTGYTSAVLTSMMEFAIRNVAGILMTYQNGYRMYCSASGNNRHQYLRHTSSWADGSSKSLYTQLFTLYLPMLGWTMVLTGQALRTIAMYTAGSSFDHQIQIEKKTSHVLVTHGIYHWIRHPSYVGFYYYSIGTQLILGNALHSIIFAIVTNMFFRRRIPYEEETLCSLFGPNVYGKYARSTYIGIPFIPPHATIIPIDNVTNSDERDEQED